MAAKSPIELVRELTTEVAVLRSEFDASKDALTRADLVQSRERLAVLETHVAELKLAKQEADKRQWQFVYIFAGALAALLSSVVVNLLLWALKK